MVFAWLLPSAAAAPCAVALAVATWTDELASAEAAFAARDEAGFDAAMTQAGVDLGCLDGPVDPATAARYHRLVALRLYVRHDEAGATLAFAAARAVDPFGALPSALLPPGHEARLLSERAATPGRTEHAPRPRKGELRFDGHAGLDRPLDRPTLLQVLGDGDPIDVYLAPGDPLPVYPSATLHPAAHWGLAGVGLAAAVGSAVAYAFAYDAAATLDGTLPPSTTRDDVVALQERADTLVLVSGGSALVAAGAVTAAVVRW